MKLTEKQEKVITIKEMITKNYPPEKELNKRIKTLEKKGINVLGEWDHSLLVKHTTNK